MLEALKVAVKQFGVTDVEVDHDWSNRQPATRVKGDRVLSFGEMYYHFYPTMLRWKRRSGERRLCWLEPEIDQSGPRPRLEVQKMMQRFFDIIAADAVLADQPKGDE